VCLCVAKRGGFAQREWWKEIVISKEKTKELREALVAVSSWATYGLDTCDVEDVLTELLKGTVHPQDDSRGDEIGGLEEAVQHNAAAQPSDFHENRHRAHGVRWQLDRGRRIEPALQHFRNPSTSIISVLRQQDDVVRHDLEGFITDSLLGNEAQSFALIQLTMKCAHEHVHALHHAALHRRRGVPHPHMNHTRRSARQ
jgi:hypothetical protein